MKALAPLLAFSIAWGCSGSTPAEVASPTSPTGTLDAEYLAPSRVRHDLQVNEPTLTVWEKSPASPKGTIVLVHGRTWSSLPDFDLQVPGEERSLMDALAKSGYASFALDQRGYGATKRDQSGWLTPDQAADDLAAVLRWVKDRSGSSPALLGWSYGSLVSQLCTQRHPELVSALVLYGYPRGINSTYPIDAEGEPTPPRNATTAEGAAEDFIADGAASPAMVRAFVKKALAADPVRADWRHRDEFNALDPTKIVVPTLLMHGEEDPYAPVAKQAEVFAAIKSPDKAWVVLGGGDHAAHLETTGPLFVRTLLAFLK